MDAVDLFIVYDNIKYTKKGWINRNRMLQNGKDVMFSLPLKNASDSLHVRDRSLSEDFKRDKMLNGFREAYRRAPYFEQAFPLMEEILSHQDRNLFGFLFNSLIKSARYIGVATEFKSSSGIAIDHELKNQDKVLALCAAYGADRYINPIGGLGLYSKDIFQRKGIDLRFIRSQFVEYKQFNDPFVPWLSIVDVMMFNPVDKIREWIAHGYELI